MKLDGKGRGFGKLLDDGFGVVGGAVVCDDQFIRLAGLVYEALELLLDVLGTVVGGHGYGDFHGLTLACDQSQKFFTILTSWNVASELIFKWHFAWSLIIRR